MHHIWSDDLHMQKEVLGQCVRDPPPNDIEFATGIGDQGAGGVKLIGSDLPQRAANIVDYGIGELVERVVDHSSVRWTTFFGPLFGPPFDSRSYVQPCSASKMEPIKLLF